MAESSICVFLLESLPPPLRAVASHQFGQALAGVFAGQGLVPAGIRGRYGHVHLQAIPHALLAAGERIPPFARLEVVADRNAGVWLPLFNNTSAVWFVPPFW